MQGVRSTFAAREERKTSFPLLSERSDEASSGRAASRCDRGRAWRTMNTAVSLAFSQKMSEHVRRHEPHSMDSRDAPNDTAPLFCIAPHLEPENSRKKQKKLEGFFCSNDPRSDGPGVRHQHVGPSQGTPVLLFDVWAHAGLSFPSFFFFRRRERYGRSIGEPNVVP